MQSQGSFRYDYDSHTNNIVLETCTGGSYAGQTTYAYDILGQLIRENDCVKNATYNKRNGQPEDNPRLPHLSKANHTKREPPRT